MPGYWCEAGQAPGLVSGVAGLCLGSLLRPAQGSEESSTSGQNANNLPGQCTVYTDCTSVHACTSLTLNSPKYQALEVMQRDIFMHKLLISVVQLPLSLCALMQTVNAPVKIWLSIN